jgi:D-alanyl-D-alanine carboxypeptidase
MTNLFSHLRTWRFQRRIASLHAALGIPADYARQRGLPLQPEARRLVAVGPDIYQREQRLLEPAAHAWHQMVRAGARDGIEIQLVSAYRSVSYQEGIVRKKLQCGQAIEEILCVSAAPGFSEHHSGRAVDLTTPGYPVLEEEFEDSAAFAWLSNRAADFGFQLSYPRDNPHGVAYEPWHWAWRGDRSK